MDSNKKVNIQQFSIWSILCFIVAIVALLFSLQPISKGLDFDGGYLIVAAIVFSAFGTYLYHDGINEKMLLTIIVLAIGEAVIWLAIH